MRDRTRAVCTILIVAFGLVAPAALRAQPPQPERWEATLALRITPAAPGPVAVRVALPFEAAEQTLEAVEVAARGLEVQIVRDDPHPHVLLRGRLKGPRRVAISFRVTGRERSGNIPAVRPLEIPTSEILPYLTPAPLFQARSILVRDFLESNVAPVLNQSEGVLQAIFRVTREQLAYKRNGKSLPLDVIRRRQGKRIGIERAFTTFLRCARIPARFVEGVNLKSSTRRKRVFWTEVWAENRWWPVSASQGEMGRLPAHYVGVARDGPRLAQVVEGDASATYSIQARRVHEESNSVAS